MMQSGTRARWDMCIKSGNIPWQYGVVICAQNSTHTCIRKHFKKHFGDGKRIAQTNQISFFLGKKNNTNIAKCRQGDHPGIFVSGHAGLTSSHS